MSLSLTPIKAMLEQMVLAMPGVLPTAFENIVFQPSVGPYQSCYHLINRPINHSIERDMPEERGILQLTLRYPEGKGRQQADTMADAIKAHFAPVQCLGGAGFNIILEDDVAVASGIPSEGRWIIPISIYWRAFSV